MIIKVANDYLKYSYHLTFDHIKLLYFLVNEKNNEKYMDLNQLEMVEQKQRYYKCYNTYINNIGF